MQGGRGGRDRCKAERQGVGEGLGIGDSDWCTYLFLNHPWSSDSPIKPNAVPLSCPFLFVAMH